MKYRIRITSSIQILKFLSEAISFSVKKQILKACFPKFFFYFEFFFQLFFYMNEIYRKRSPFGIETLE